MAARSTPRCCARAPPPRQRSPTPERGVLHRTVVQTAKKAAPPRSGPFTFCAAVVRRALLPDVGDALLSLRLGCRRRLRGKLQHGCLLTLDEFRQQDGLPIRKFERGMAPPGLGPVALPNDRVLVR